MHDQIKSLKSDYALKQKEIQQNSLNLDEKMKNLQRKIEIFELNEKV